MIDSVGVSHFELCCCSTILFPGRHLSIRPFVVSLSTTYGIAIPYTIGDLDREHDLIAHRFRVKAPGVRSVSLPATTALFPSQGPRWRVPMHKSASQSTAPTQALNINNRLDCYIRVAVFQAQCSTRGLQVRSGSDLLSTCLTCQDHTMPDDGHSSTSLQRPHIPHPC